MGPSYSNDCYVLQVHHHPDPVSLFFDAFDLGSRGGGGGQESKIGWKVIVSYKGEGDGHY